jgi:hypothetical protein
MRIPDWKALNSFRSSRCLFVKTEFVQYHTRPFNRGRRPNAPVTSLASAHERSAARCDDDDDDVTETVATSQDETVIVKGAQGGCEWSLGVAYASDRRFAQRQYAHSIGRLQYAATQTELNNFTENC